MSERTFEWRVFKLGDRVQYALYKMTTELLIPQTLRCPRERSIFNVSWGI